MGCRSAWAAAAVTGDRRSPGLLLLAADDVDAVRPAAVQWRAASGHVRALEIGRRMSS